MSKLGHSQEIPATTFNGLDKLETISITESSITAVKAALPDSVVTIDVSNNDIGGTLDMDALFSNGGSQVYCHFTW